MNQNINGRAFAEYATSILNIGLNGTNLAQANVITITKAILGGMNVRSTAIYPGTDEDTLVVACYTDIAPGLVYNLAKALSQQAIAYYNIDHDFGLLIGPEAHLWDDGKFNPELFVLPDGEMLA